ncbi:MAG TPA: MBL fold metallo-hydrolase [Chlamydiales bacterium]|nr:MBL fold metallo-hydrolase [Chlamydiales bacterium]
MLLYTFPSGPLQTNAILFGENGIGAVIDPSPGSAKKILHQACQDGITIEKILLTHSHWDHIADVHALKEKTDAELYVHAFDRKNVQQPGSDGLPLMMPIPAARPDHVLQEGGYVTVGHLQLQVIHTPGHSPGSVCFYLASHEILFSGDTLFKGRMGRIDLPTGHPENMWHSLKKLAHLPFKTRVLPGHGPDTTIGQENWLDKAEELFNNIATQ